MAGREWTGGPSNLASANRQELDAGEAGAGGVGTMRAGRLSGSPPLPWFAYLLALTKTSRTRSRPAHFRRLLVFFFFFVVYFVAFLIGDLYMYNNLLGFVFLLLLVFLYLILVFARLLA